MAMTAAIEAFELYRFFHTEESETLALRGVSLGVAAGEMVALLGASGCGKSTLLNCLAGLDEPDGGHVELLGVRLTRRPEAERAGRRARSIGILMQANNLMPNLRLVDNMVLAMQLAGKPDSSRASGLFEQLGQWPGVLTVGVFAHQRAQVCLLGTADGVKTLRFGLRT